MCFAHAQAASLLKRAEGIVTLIVCNPNKKDDKKDDVNKTPKIEKKGKPKPHHMYLVQCTLFDSFYV